MKKYLFLIVLVFFITIISLGNYVISVKLNISDQDFMSKTKENSEIYKGKVLSETKEVRLIDLLLKKDISKQQEVTNQSTLKLNELEEDTIPKVIELTIVNQVDEEPTTSQEVEQPTINEIVEQDTTQAQAIQLSQASVIPKYAFLTSDGDIPNDSILTAETEIARIPQHMLNAFASEGWRIEISNTNISSKYFGGKYGNVMGVTITAEHAIVIQNRTKSIQSSIVHEFGHYIDTRFDFPSLSDEFWDIYLAEVDTFISRIPNASSVRDEMEFFASTFYYMIKDPSKCTPRATEFVQRYMNSF